MPVTLRSLRDRLLQHEELNFLLTNRVPRLWLTRVMRWFSRIEQPLVRDVSIAVWRAFSDLDLSDAKQTRFRSMHDCFTRELRDGARPIDPDPQLLTSPCDAIVGACGAVEDTRVFQAKGFPYSIEELFGFAPPRANARPADAEAEAAVAPWRDGVYVTLRLTSAMYHRFHAPHDGAVEEVRYIAGDAWNVNPIALARVDRLYCRNERAVLRMRLDAGAEIALVPVAAILVASLRLAFCDLHLHLDYDGPRRIACRAALRKGEAMGHFEQGSTIIVFAPRGCTLVDGVAPGARIRMGRPLVRLASR